MNFVLNIFNPLTWLETYILVLKVVWDKSHSKYLPSLRRIFRYVLFWLNITDLSFLFQKHLRIFQSFSSKHESYIGLCPKYLMASQNYWQIERSENSRMSADAWTKTSWFLQRNKRWILMHLIIMVNGVIIPRNQKKYS